MKSRISVKEVLESDYIVNHDSYVTTKTGKPYRILNKEKVKVLMANRVTNASTVQKEESEVEGGVRVEGLPDYIHFSWDTTVIKNLVPPTSNLDSLVSLFKEACSVLCL